jgi:hypothetical protein
MIKIFLTLFFMFFCNFSFSKDCNELKSVFLDKSQTQNDMDEFKKGVDAGDLCHKNLMGVLLYEGIFFPQDISRAESIFFDLSNKGNPEAQFNFAWIQSKKADQNPNDVVYLLLGIHSKYISDVDNAHLSTKARNYGRIYLRDLPSGKYGDTNKLRDDFESSVKKTILDFSSAIQTRKDRINQNTDNLVAVFSIGLAVYGATAPQSGSYNPQWKMTPSSGGNIYSFQ